MWARKLAGQAPIAKELIKQTSAKGDIEDGIEAEKQAFGAAFGSEDAKEGISAFLGKRTPEVAGQLERRPRSSASALAELIERGRLGRRPDRRRRLGPSGIPDFRTPETGLWENVDPMEVAHIDVFRATRPASGPTTGPASTRSATNGPTAPTRRSPSSSAAACSTASSPRTSTACIARPARERWSRCTARSSARPAPRAGELRDRAGRRALRLATASPSARLPGQSNPMSSSSASCCRKRR